MAEAKRLILREERTFLMAVEGTFCVQALDNSNPARLGTTHVHMHPAERNDLS